MFCCCASDRPAGVELGSPVPAEIALADILKDLDARSDPLPKEEPAPAEPEPAGLEPSEPGAAPEPAREPAAVPLTFDVVLSDLTGGPGLNVDLRGSTLAVLSVADGAVRRYNASAPEERQVRLHDFVLEVNGKTAAAEMAEELETSTLGKLSLKFQHALPFKASVPKNGKMFGITLSFAATGPCVCIKEILDGEAVSAYNKTAAEDLQIMVNDRILEVNAVSGNATAMIEASKSGGVIELSVARPNLPVAGR